MKGLRSAFKDAGVGFEWIETRDLADTPMEKLLEMR